LVRNNTIPNYQLPIGAWADLKINPPYGLGGFGDQSALRGLADLEINPPYVLAG
jgi:hypothetical protein